MAKKYNQSILQVFRMLQSIANDTQIIRLLDKMCQLVFKYPNYTQLALLLELYSLVQIDKEYSYIQFLHRLTECEYKTSLFEEFSAFQARIIESRECIKNVWLLALEDVEFATVIQKSLLDDETTYQNIGNKKAEKILIDVEHLMFREAHMPRKTIEIETESFRKSNISEQETAIYF